MSQVLIHNTKDNQVVNIQLNFPEKRNILTREMILELTNTFVSVSQNAETRVVILSGKGMNFCAGGDLRWLHLKPNSSDLTNTQEVSDLFKLFDEIDSCSVPVIGKVHGSVFGGGLGLVSVCDIIAAQKDAQFCFSELKLGLIPSTIAPFVLKKMLPSQFQELVLSARVFSSEEAFRKGLIHFYGSLVECEQYITQLTNLLLSYEKTAVSQAKKLLRRIPQLSFEQAREYSIQSLAERRKSPEVSKKIIQFLKKTK